MPEDTHPPEAKNGHRLVSGLHVLRTWQDGTSICLDRPREDLFFWLSYLDIGRDYQAVIDSTDRENSYFTAAAMSGAGIRILHQDPWKAIITFVISQQEATPDIRRLAETLGNRYGTVLEDGRDLGREDDRGKANDREKENDREEENDPGRCLPPACSFPAPNQLCLASLGDLVGLKLGYRARYTHRLCQGTVSGRLELSRLNTLGYEGAMEYLTGFYRIGRKAANCVCFFGLHHMDTSPVDTQIEKILMGQHFDRRKYRCIPRSRLCETIVEDVFGRYSGCIGIMQ